MTISPHPSAIALFGTSADPPTHGHRALLEGLLSHYPQVATWASDNPLKQHKAPLSLRTALLKALVEAIGDPRLSLEQKLSSPWTFETLKRARQRWPQADGAALRRDTVTLVIQVKGKVRGQLEVPADADAATLEALALSSEVAAKWLEGQPPRRVIVVPGKLVNLVP